MAPAQLNSPHNPHMAGPTANGSSGHFDSSLALNGSIRSLNHSARLGSVCSKPLSPVFDIVPRHVSCTSPKGAELRILFDDDAGAVVPFILIRNTPSAMTRPAVLGSCLGQASHLHGAHGGQRRSGPGPGRGAPSGPVAGDDSSKWWTTSPRFAKHVRCRQRSRKTTAIRRRFSAIRSTGTITASRQERQIAQSCMNCASCRHPW